MICRSLKMRSFSGMLQTIKMRLIKKYEELEYIEKNKRAKLHLKIISDLLRLAVNEFLVKLL